MVNDIDIVNLTAMLKAILVTLCDPVHDRHVYSEPHTTRTT